MSQSIADRLDEIATELFNRGDVDPIVNALDEIVKELKHFRVKCCRVSPGYVQGRRRCENCPTRGIDP